MAKRAEAKVTRAGFVRGCPADMSVEEVIEKGKKAGLEIKPADVHAARYYMRQQPTQGKRSVAAQEIRLVANQSGGQEADLRSQPRLDVHADSGKVREISGLLGPEQQFVLLCKRIGTVRAYELIEQIESSIDL